MHDWVKDAKDNKCNAIQTVLHEWHLTCLTMDLPDNDVNSDDAEAVDGAVSYRQSWDQDMFHGACIEKAFGCFSFPVVRRT